MDDDPDHFLFELGPPGLLMEDDKEEEWLIVRPIIEDVIDSAVADAKMRQLQRIVEHQMQEVTVETEAQRLRDFMGDILSKCIDEVVKTANPPQDEAVPEVDSFNLNIDSVLGNIDVAEWTPRTTTVGGEEDVLIPTLDPTPSSAQDMGIIEISENVESSSDEDNADKTKTLDDSDPQQARPQEEKVRKVAKVSPYEGLKSSSRVAVIMLGEDETSSQQDEQNQPDLTNEQDQNLDHVGADDSVDPLSDLADVSNVNTEPVRPILGLRLRNFAIDPASASIPRDNDESPSTSAASISGLGSTWHTTEGDPEPSTSSGISDLTIVSAFSQQQQQQEQPSMQYEPIVVEAQHQQIVQEAAAPTSPVMPIKFNNILDESRFMFHLHDHRDERHPYFIITGWSNTKTQMKFFIPRHVKAKTMSFQNPTWQTGTITFIPSPERARIVQLSFKPVGQSNAMIIRFFLPIDDMRTKEIVLNDELFALSVPRVNEIMDRARARRQKPLIYYAQELEANSLYAVDVRQMDRCYAISLFSHLEKVSAITPALRETTIQHFALAFDVFKINQSANNLEGQIFLKYGYNVDCYRTSASQELGKWIMAKRKCLLCEEEFAQESSQYLSHLSRLHFVVRLSHWARKERCPRQEPTCVWSQSLADRMIHMGVRHEVSKEVETSLVSTMKHLIPTLDAKFMTCVIDSHHAGCGANSKKFSIYGFLMHSYSTPVIMTKVEDMVNQLQSAFATDKSQCIIDDCPMRFTKRDLLLKHIGVDHCSLLNFVLPMMKDNDDHHKTMIKILNAYRRVIVGADKVVVCHLCGGIYGSKTELNYHRTIQHNTVNLMSNFPTVSAEVPNGAGRSCLLCSKIMADTYIGAIHLGVCHSDKIVNDLFTLYHNNDNNPAAAVQPRQQPEPPQLSPQQQLQPHFWYYQCPICGVKINSHNDKNASTNHLLVHVVTSHEQANFRNIMRNMNLHCPVKGCQRQLGSLQLLIDHVVTSHVLYLNDFLKKHMKGFSPRDCFVPVQKPPQTQNVEAAPVPPVPVASLKQTDNQSDDIQITMVVSQPKSATTTAATVVSQPQQQENLSTTTSNFAKYTKWCLEKRIDPFRSSPIDVVHFILNACKEDKMSLAEINAFLAHLDVVHIDKNKLSKNKMIEHTLNNIRTKRQNKPMPASARSRQNRAAAAAATTGMLVTPAPEVFKPQEQQEDNSIVVTKVVQPTSSNLEKPFVCHACSPRAADFANVRLLVEHLDIVHPGEQARVGCKFCKLDRQCRNDVEAYSYLVFHTFSKVHMYNRWHALRETFKPTNPRLKDKFSTPLRTVPQDQLDRIICEPCGEAGITNLDSHVKTAEHKNNGAVINNFVQFCDLRETCPVTCGLDDLAFYLEYVYPKTLAKNQDKKMIRLQILKVLVVLSKVHDEVDGKQIMMHGTLLDKCNALMSNPNAIKGVANYICYCCPKFARDLDDLYNHVNSFSHKIAVGISDKTPYRCQICNKVFQEFWHVELHEFSISHITNANAEEAGYVLPALPLSKDDNMCYICDGVAVKAEHLNSPSHKQAKVIVAAFLKYCQRLEIVPTKIDAHTGSKFMDTHNTFNHAAMIKAIKRLNPSIASDQLSTTTSSPSGTARLATSTTPAASKKLASTDFDPYGLNQEVEDDVTRCPECFQKFLRSTYLLYHIQHNHRKRSAKFILDIMDMDKYKLDYACNKCSKKCRSPIVLALHHDRHRFKNNFLTCPTCNKNYISPAAYFKTDNCKRNCLPEAVKEEIDLMIVKACERDPLSHVIGSKERFRAAFKHVLPSKTNPGAVAKPKGAKPSKEKSTRERNSRDDDFVPSDFIEEEEDDYGEMDVDDKSDAESFGSIGSISVDKPALPKTKPCKVVISVKDQMTAKKALQGQEPKLRQPPILMKIKTKEIMGIKNTDALEQVKPIKISLARLKTEKQETPAPSKVESASEEHHQSQSKPCPKRRKTASRNWGYKKRKRVNTSPSATPASVKKIKLEEDVADDGRIVVKPVMIKMEKKKEEIHEKVAPSAVTPSKPKLTSDSTPSKKKEQASIKSFFKAESKTSPSTAATSKKKIGPKSKQKTSVPHSGETISFCVVCEGCDRKSCNHRGHPRKVLIGNDPSVCQRHCNKTGHDSFQSLDNFLPMSLTVKLPDLSYSEKHGANVRKQYKKYVKDKKLEGSHLEYSKKKPCKMPKCDYSTESVVLMFRHIRNQHLGDES